MMDFRELDRLNRRDMLRGTAMLGAGAALMQPLPLWAQSGTMTDIETLINHFLAVGWGLDMPAGESFAMVEQPKGNSGYYVVSDGRNSPYRLRIRTPSFAVMQTLPELCRGHMISDLLAVIGAMDYVLADIDR